jgi:acyl-coenzyme A thioesterase PaaI-like protein
MTAGEAQLLELPHTRGCMVCGRDNASGLKLALFVDPASGVVRVDYTPRGAHIGFEGVVHGGVLATVLDEAMVWAATWAGKRFCLCGEMTVRYRAPAAVGRPLAIEARVESARPRLVQAVADIRDAAGEVIVSASGKYVRLPPDRNRAFVATLIDEPATSAAARRFREAASV